MPCYNEIKNIKAVPVNIERVIMAEIRPGLDRTAHEVMETYKGAATSDAPEDNPKSIAEVAIATSK
ncbi:MAG: hypothetical protein U9R38_08170 [Candidatus Margulisiibacteriota bacterium]|nr:hypothetical protein [Candidatus Margulisiibacteriota bacterium]